ncbi:MAG: helix-turn-helix domain-containing protein [Tannerella sp.]|jgi:HTH-type transcriptional regulator/antitoxin HigA|nr:helix-turn-helix domain-containing protein [Tannerella sp.]
MKKITTEAEYEAIMHRVDELVEIVDDNTPATDPNYVELDLLTDMVVAYEKEHFPVSKPDLVETIKLRMYEMDLNQTKLAALIGVSTSRVNEYLSRKSEPTLNDARNISRKMNINPSIVLGV